MTMKRLIAGLAIGAGLMYLFDPRNGKDRRQQLRERFTDAKSNLEGRMQGADDYGSDIETEFGRMSDRATSKVRSTAADTREAAVETLSGSE